MRPESVRRRAIQASPAIAAASLVAAPIALADTATSASFQIQAGTLDTAGGRSTSANHVVTACVGSEIAGTSSSASHHIDSGCGATALAVVIPNGGGSGPGSGIPVPVLSDASTFLLIALLFAVGATRLRPRATRPPGP